MKKKSKNFLAEYSGFLDSSGQHLTYAALSTYRSFTDELSEKEKQFLKRHLDICAQCSARLREITDVESPQPPLIEKIYPLVAAGSFRYSVAAVVVIAFGVAFYMLNQPKQEQASKIPPATPHSIAQVPTNPERFIPNQLLENFVERNVRSVSSVTMLSPSNGDTISVPFTVKWTSVKGVHRFGLILVDNRNTEVWKGKTSAGSLTVTKELEKGLYYSKLEVDGELTQVRKFVVVR